MKKLLICLSVLSIIACKEEPKDYVSLSGKIINKNSDSLIVYQGRDISKTIKVNEDGTFSDTLKVTPGVYSIFDGKDGAPVYLKNDLNIKIFVDTENYNESLVFSGKGHENSTFLADKMKLESSLLDIEAMKSLDSAGLESKITSIKKELNAFLDSGKDIDSTIIAKSKKDVEPMLNYYKQYIAEGIALKKSLPKGSVSPSFKNYENIDGSKTSLADLKGKYVYIDIWATWCAPCKAEIPSLKKLDKDYSGKNVTFVSLSVDDDRSHKGSWDKAKGAWKNMVKEKALTGVHLFAPKGWTSQFIRDYKINGIPRFVLIDPNGNIVNPDAPRPSDPELRELFTSLNI